MRVTTNLDSRDYLPKEWENRLAQAIKLANVIREDIGCVKYLDGPDNHGARSVVEQIAGTGPRSEATWRMAIKIATEVK